MRDRDHRDDVVLGFNKYGTLGTDGPASSVPQRVGTSTLWASVSGAQYGVFATQSDGSLWALGTVGAPASFAPFEIWVSVANALNDYCAVAIDHSLWCAGYDADGELGDGARTDEEELEEIAP